MPSASINVPLVNCWITKPMTGSPNMQISSLHILGVVPKGGRRCSKNTDAIPETNSRSSSEKDGNMVAERIGETCSSPTSSGDVFSETTATALSESTGNQGALRSGVQVPTPTHSPGGDSVPTTVVPSRRRKYSFDSEKTLQ